MLMLGAACGEDGAADCRVEDACIEQCQTQCADTGVAAIICRGAACICECAPAP